MLIANLNGCAHISKCLISQKFVTHTFWIKNAATTVSCNSSLISSTYGHRRHLLLDTQSKLLLKTLHSRNISTQSFFLSVSQSAPVLFFQQTLVDFHDFSHLPWWAVIFLTTIGVRSLITFPLTLYQAKILAKYSNLKPEIASLASRIKYEVSVAVKKYQWDEKQAKRAFNVTLRKHRQNAIVRENCHPFKASIVIWFQIPIWICISFALRNIVYIYPTANIIPYLTMTTEGTLWFTNLTVHDPTFLLPLFFGIVNLAIVEIVNPSKLNKALNWFLRGFSIILVPIACTVPSCLSLYWLTSSSIGLVHNVLLISPTVRRFCRIPSVEGESSTPYRDIINKLKTRLEYFRTK